MKTTSEIKEDLGILHLFAIQSVSDEALDRFPDLSNTEALYDSVTISYVGMVFFYAYVKILQGGVKIDFDKMFVMADEVHCKLKKMNSEGFVPLDFMAVANRLAGDLSDRLDRLVERSKKYETDKFKLLAHDIAGWVVTNLTNRVLTDSDYDCVAYFETFIYRCIVDECAIDPDLQTQTKTGSLFDEIELFK